ncbi:MAG: hypothetical protein VKQ33_00140 [Candidatus Sericytochromatia bacterium]|nr:hypothetical protein [Candidatus Sericytochromatia bacterium]
MAEPSQRRTWLRRLGAVPAALLFPGLGQAVNAEWGKAGAVCLAFFGAFAGVLGEAGRLVAALGGEATGLVAVERLSEPAATAALAQAGPAASLGPLAGWVALLLGVIAYSIWDAWRGAARGGGRP